MYICYLDVSLFSCVAIIIIYLNSNGIKDVWKWKMYSGLSIQSPTSYTFTFVIEITDSFNILLFCQLID